MRRMTLPFGQSRKRALICRTSGLLIAFAFSYGGHYGPAFAAFFLQQNAAIQAGTLKGTILNLKTLGIGNGLTVSNTGAVVYE